ncbi:hypothetical protein P7C71_g3396, partial [Lecanoromycetidae sp. Uapishka_2]
MPSKTTEKERKADLDTPRSKSKSRHKHSRSARKLEKLAIPLESSSRSPSPVTAKRRVSMPIPERERQDTSNSPLGSKTSLPYPKFSKEHSKEAVGSRENVANPRLSYYTPDPTDLEKVEDNGPSNGAQQSQGVAPPSPPETEMEQEELIEKPKVKAVRIDKIERKGTDLQRAAEKLKKRLGRSASDLSGREKERHSHLSKSRNSLRETEKDDDSSSPPARRSKAGTPSKLRPPKQATVEDSASSTASFRKPSPASVHSAAKSESTIDSGATERPMTPHAERNSSPATDPDSSPRTPTISEPQYPLSGKEIPFSALGNTPQTGGLSSTFGESPMPPPPPPPPTLPMPKVDYLLQNGGLPQSVPKSLLGAGPLAQNTVQTPSLAATIPNQVFAPFHKLLDDYDKVMSRSGSLAVATGYRSVARRLLDRLEAVFARDISSQTCTCVICQTSQGFDAELDDKRGVSWGEILEYVCGRQELPQWPAFVMDVTQVGLGLCASEHVPPMQQLDIDVPEEFRDHYVRQSKKTKSSVDRWLDNQPQHPSSPPQDVDDETLTFAMLTRLEPGQRPTFSSLVGVVPSRPASTAGRQTPLIDPGSGLLQSTGHAIQRLYRLGSPPRDPESAMYLLTNPHIHNVLATLAAISDHEWEVLTSGRFDGFLRSGADDTPSPSGMLPSRGPTPASRTPAMPPSRGPTPFSRGPTPAPASIGAPVALDEETEIAVLAEVEREIYLGMEALEGNSTPFPYIEDVINHQTDAFESLHLKAETVRRALLDRGAGLSQANIRRRGSVLPDTRFGTPSSNFGEGNYRGWDSETDDGFDDGESVMPDDSASNISSSRHRRPKRRHERRTPAPVEEEDEEAISEVESKAGRRREK